MDDARKIENLIYLYAELIDHGDFQGVADLFRDGEIVSPAYHSTQTGFDEVLKMYQQSCRLYQPGDTPLTKHLTTNVIINLSDNGVEAAARSYYTVIQTTETLPLQPIISGRYNDSFFKHQGTWAFKRREMFVDLVGNCSAHLLYEAV